MNFDNRLEALTQALCGVFAAFSGPDRKPQVEWIDATDRLSPGQLPKSWLDSANMATNSNKAERSQIVADKFHAAHIGIAAGFGSLVAAILATIIGIHYYRRSKRHREPVFFGCELPGWRKAPRQLVSLV